MNVLEKILEEIEEKFKTADAEKFDCEELCDVEDWYDSGYIDGQLSAHEKCMDIIRSHMGDGKGTNVPSNEGWIPVEERLPDAGNGKYYPLLNVATSYGAVKCGFYRVRDKQWYIYKEIYNEFVEARDKEIVAWQNFPQPYKPAEN